MSEGKREKWVAIYGSRTSSVVGYTLYTGRRMKTRQYILPRSPLMDDALVLQKKDSERMIGS